MRQDLRVFYDEESDILYIARKGYEQEFVEIQPGVNLELDGQRQIIGIEIMRASAVLGEVIEPLRHKVKSED